MSKLRKVLVGTMAVLTLGIAGCGGGSSSGGGSGGGSIFTGTATISLSSPGIPKQTTSGGITITVSPSGVTVTDGVSSGTAPLSADGTMFSVPIVESASSGGVTCSVKFVFNGDIAGTRITGDIGGSGSCRGFGRTSSVTPSGSFSATQTSSAKARVGNPISDSISNILENISN